MKTMLAGFLALGILLSSLLGGVVYEIEVKDHGQSTPKRESLQAAVEGRYLKMGIASSGEGEKGEMIFRGDRREMIVVNHDNRIYHVMDEAAIGQIAGQLSQVEQQMREALKNVPEDKRTMIEQMMKQRMPQQQVPQRSETELKKTSERAEHNGYPCVKYEVFLGGQKIREVWVTDWSNVEGGTDFSRVFEDMSDFLKEMRGSFSGAFGSVGGSPNAFEHMKEIGGFPVVSRDFGEDGSLEGESSLRSARRQTMDPNAFEPPSGYKRQEMFRSQ